MERCPAADEVDAVLDRLAAPARDALVRAHVAACTRCLDQHGARFELELWGAAFEPGARTTPRTRTPAMLAAAAGVLLAAGLARWQPWFDADEGAAPVAADPVAAATPRAQILEWTLEVGECGPQRAHGVRKEWSPALPDRLRVIEAARAADGLAWRHERSERVASSKENGP